MIIVLIGPPGAGKTKQSHLLNAREHAVWLSTGAMLRELGIPQINKIMARGDLVDDRIINQFMGEKIDTIAKSKVIVLDGYPRHKVQAEWLLDYSEKTNRNVVAVIHLIIPREETFRRLAKRGRPDDSAESIENRLDDYEQSFVPVVDYLKNSGLPIHEVDGNRPVEEVFKSIDKIVRDVHENKK